MSTCILRFNTEPVRINVEPGMTVAQAFAKYANALGFDPSLSVTYKSGDSVIPGSALLLDGATIVASTVRESKG